MSHESSEADAGPGNFKKMAASLIAGLVIAIGQVIRAVLRTVFGIISMLAGAA
ncbi:MAG: hypothetical protein ABEJ93_00955 [Candidatus Nanohalobium sp.]